MNLCELRPAVGSKEKSWRRGRGHATGNGKTAGRNSKEIVAIKVCMLNVFENDTVVDIDALKAVGLISNPRDGVKILGEGELERKLTIKVNQFSKTALEKIEAAGGKAEVI